MGFCVPQQCYDELLQHLAEDSIPRTVHMVGIIHNALEGSISANFYTDSWPDFSALVCQLIFPRLSDEWDILCYATSNEILCKLLKERNLITVGKQQVLAEMDEGVLDHLKEFLMRVYSISLQRINKFVQFHLPKSSTASLDIQCPEGYSIRRLDPCHAAFVDSHWPFPYTWSNRLSWFKGRIKNFTALGAFIAGDDSDESQPVAWVTMYPYFEIGHLFTLEEHRGKGLASAITAALCRTLKKNYPEIIPYCLLARGSTNKIFEKLGFISSEYKNCYGMIDFS